MIDLYPDLRLIDNIPEDYASSMATIADIMAKMELLGAHDLLLSLHRHPENNFTGAQTHAAFVRTLRTLAQQAAQKQIVLQLRMTFGKPPWNVSEACALLDEVGAANLQLAVSTALLSETTKTEEISQLLRRHIGSWLIAAPQRDLNGKLWDAHAPIHERIEGSRLLSVLSVAPQVPLLLDGLYSSQDEEYLEAKTVEHFP